jgi:Leu/Phe-tRNA-protein transferase
MLARSRLSSRGVDVSGGFLGVRARVCLHSRTTTATTTTTSAVSLTSRLFEGSGRHGFALIECELENE